MRNRGASEMERGIDTDRDHAIPHCPVGFLEAREDVTTGFSTVALSPGYETEEHESWYINMGIATKGFLDPHQMQNYAH